MATQREIIVRLRAEVADYKKAMADAAKATETLATENKKTAKDAAAAAEKTHQAWSEVGTGLLAVGAAITAVGVAAAKTGIDYNTLQQTSRAALKTLLGSAEAANEQMDKLDAFARTSPFSKAVFITAQQQLIGFGRSAKEVIPILDAVQNAVAATGGSNEDIKDLVSIIAKVGAAGKITAEDLNQFGDRGVDAATLIGSQMGKTGAQIRTEITAGSLDAGEAIKALTVGMDQRFGGAAANVKNSFAGATDRVKAAFRDLSSDLMAPMVGPNGGGFLIDIANGAADAMRAFQTLPAPVKIATESLGGLVGVAALLGGSFLTIKPKIEAFNTALGVMHVSVKAVWTTIGVVAGVFAVASIALGLYAKNQAEAKARVDDYKASLDQATQAITTNTRAVAFNNLQSDGAIDKAKALGINLTDLVTASLHPVSEAYDRVSAAGKIWEDRLAAQRAATDYNQGKVADLSGKVNDFGDVMRSAGLQSDALRGAQSSLGDQMAAGVGATDAAAAATTATAAATTAATKALEAWTKMTGEADASFVDIGGAYQGVIDKNTELATSTADKTKSTADSWKTYYDGVKVSAADYIKQLQDQVTAQQNWETNMLAIATRVKTGMTGAMADAAFQMLDELMQLGPKGAAQVALLKSMTDEQFTQVVTLYSEKGTAAVAGFTADYAALKPPTIIPTIDTTPARAAFQRMITDMQGNLVAVQYFGGRTISKAGGGLITGPGTGTSDSIHALVSNREYIVKADAVQHYGVNFFDNLNAKRFATGGYVGGGSGSSGSSMAGLAIEGTLDLGNGLTGYMRGVVKSELAQAQSSRTSAMSRGTR